MTPYFIFSDIYIYQAKAYMLTSTALATTIFYNNNKKKDLKKPFLLLLNKPRKFTDKYLCYQKAWAAQ